MGCEQSKPEKSKKKKPSNNYLPNGDVHGKKNPNGANNSKRTKHPPRKGTEQNGVVRRGSKKGPGSGRVAPQTVQKQQLPEDSSQNSSFYVGESIGKEKESMIKLINQNVIGINATFDGPFGRRKVIYCDFVASGKPVTFIEDYIHRHVLPFYANTHTTTSVSAQQTSTFREEAREMIKFCTNATDEDAVIFTGSGSTSAIHKLLDVIELSGQKAKHTVVIIGPHEHHSNILPWRESGAKVCRIKETSHGHLDMEDLKEKLQENKNSGLDLIVSLSAASNVTGIKTDSVLVTELVHRYGGFCFWDYACAGPYLEINMNPTAKGYKDAVFISPHKFLGGPSTPGILIAKKALFTNAVPGGVGGGTVSYVFSNSTRYLSDIEEREEGGTPAIVGSIRAALAFQLKQDVGSGTIECIEDNLCKRAFQVWKKNRNIQILGSHTAERLPIFSILVSHPQSHTFLHYNYVSMLLNDLYGVQSRGGCACAGPYAIDLMCITEEVQDRLLGYLLDKDPNGMYKEPINILKPGFARLNFPFFFDKKTVEFIIKALDRVATDGWKLLPLYTYDPYSGSWYHRTKGRPRLAHLTDAALVGDRLKVTQDTGLHGTGHIDLQQVLTDADRIFDQALDLCEGLNLDDERLPIDEADQEMVWFLQPRVAIEYLRTPGLEYLPHPGPGLPFSARRNTLVRVRKQFITALSKLGHNTDKFQSRPTFYKGENEEDRTLCISCDDSC